MPKQIKLGQDSNIGGMLCVKGQVVIVGDDYDLDDDDRVLAIINVQATEREQKRLRDAADAARATRPPKIVSFTADVTTVAANSPVVLTWQVKRADTVTLEGNAVNPVDSQTVTPKRSKTYNLVATSQYGTDKARIAVVVQ